MDVFYKIEGRTNKRTNKMLPFEGHQIPVKKPYNTGSTGRVKINKI